MAVRVCNTEALCASAHVQATAAIGVVQLTSSTAYGLQGYQIADSQVNQEPDSLLDTSCVCCVVKGVVWASLL